MSLLQHILILFILILNNFISVSTTSIQSTTTEPLHEKVAAEILKIQNDLKRAEEQLLINQEIQKTIKKTDVIRLNVGGEILMTTRQTLTRIPKSILFIMFNGRWEQKLPVDQDGNIFFDFNSIIFRHLLDQLQLLDTNYISPPSDPSLITPFKKMLRKLDLNHLLSSEKNLITFNVGGHYITNGHTSFTQTFNSTFDNKSDVFIDNDPKLFQHLINQLRENPSKSLCSLEAPSVTEKITFQRMLNDMSICGQLNSSTHIIMKKKWKQNGVTIAAGNGQGNQLNQLSHLYGIFVDNDEDQSIYIADFDNHRIVQWKFRANYSEIIVVGNGMDQLNYPTDVIVDKQNDFLIICDYGNRRVVQWTRRNATNGQTIIADIHCWGLTMDNYGDLYVSDWKKDQVKRWKREDMHGTIVAGGHSQGNSLTQLSHPLGVIVDDLDDIYVADNYNHRIMRWSKGFSEGSIVVGGNGKGKQANQFNYLRDLSFDRQGNLYIIDWGNHRVQKFDVDLN